jgi:hypothetical protein
LKIVKEEEEMKPLDLGLADSMLETLADKLEAVRENQRVISKSTAGTAINKDISQCVDLIDMLLHDVCAKIDAHVPIIDETVLPVDQMQQLKIIQLEADLSASQAKVVELQDALVELYKVCDSTF